jgi:hypothetical protein
MLCPPSQFELADWGITAALGQTWAGAALAPSRTVFPA